MEDNKRILERYLVASVRLGERPAMEQLVALRGPRLIAHAVRLLGDVEEARDAVQDAWIEIFHGIAGLRDINAFPAWATRIVTRQCAKTIRRKQGHRTLRAALAVEPCPNVENAGPDAVDAALVRRAIAELPVEQSATIALFYLEDMSVAEVSVAMDVPVGTVKTRLMHARTKLKQTLEGENHD